MLVSRSIRLWFVFLFGFLLFLNSGATPTHASPVYTVNPVPFVYVSPYPGTVFASAQTSIVVRHAEPLLSSTVNSSLFYVVGTHTGVHAGRVTLSPDAHTIFFEPALAFAPGEQVRVSVQPGLTTQAGDTLPGTQWTFRVSTKPYPYEPTTSSLVAPVNEQFTKTITAGSQPAPSVSAVKLLRTWSMPAYITAPDIDTHITVTTTGEALAEGYLFAAPFWHPGHLYGQYTMIFDDRANLVYYLKHSATAVDFKLQPDGQISYFNSEKQLFSVFDNTYHEVGTWQAGNGYKQDHHDLVLMPNGHALLMIYHAEPFDLSPYGGSVTGIVYSLIIQEVDQDRNVYFEWNSLDHIPVTDTNQLLTGVEVDYIHGNALELDTDGNILLSSRHLSEITKINRTTGDIIWRLGGKQNQFTFIGDATLPNVGAFSFQHDIRRLANGNITLFDNGNDFADAGVRGSRGVEYQLDEAAKTATLVREFRSVPDVYSYYMGNVQRLPNGNTLVGWGGGYLDPLATPRQSITEFTSDGQMALSATFDSGAFVSYRAFRYPWHGYPTTPPTLVAVTNTLPISLYYSWNGATDVVSYTVAGGVTPDALTSFAIQPKTGFEELTTLRNAQDGTCFFRVTPYDKTGKPTLASNIVYLGDLLCPGHVSISPSDAISRTFDLQSAAGPVTVLLSTEAGTVVTATVLTLMSAAEIPVIPPPLDWTGLRFTLGAFDTGSLLGAAMATESFGAPLYLTLDYGALETPGLSSVYLAGWDAVHQEWTSNGIALLSNDTLSKQLAVAVTSPGAYARLTGNRLFFPDIQAQKIVSQ